jgi:PAS domain S-box-containing protein
MHISRSLALRLAVTAVVVMCGMALYESTKQFFWPSITVWESHIVTILFGTLISAGSAYLIFRKSDILQQNLASELAERKRAEALLRRSEENLRITLDSIGDAVIVTDAEGKITRMNPVAEELTGWKLADALTRKLDEVFVIRHEETGETVESPVAKVLREGTIVGLANHTEMISRSGTRLPIADSGAPIRDSGGEISGVVLVFRDQTTERDAERALRRSEGLMKSMIENLPFELWAKGTDGKYILQNPASVKKWGDRIGKDSSAINVDEKVRANWEEINRRAMAGEVVRCEWEQNDPVDGLRTFEEVIAPIYEDSHVRGILGVNVDISSRKNAEQQVLKYQQQLQSLSSRLLLVEERQRRNFSQILHDHIGQNLTYLSLKLGVLRKQVQDPATLETLGETLKLVEQMSQETRSLTYELSPPLLYEIGLDAALEWLGEHFQGRYGLDCNFELSNDSEKLHVDARIVLFQAARELLFNVVKHAQAKSATVACVRSADRVCVTISDDGIGFDPAKSGSSDGYGLFNVRERMEHLGGEVEIVSSPCNGTRVTLLLPVTQH